MASFSKSSKQKLETGHQDLQTIFNYVIKHFDCTILCGTRGEKEQNKAYENGFSKVKFPNSRHNSSPSEAIDAIPYPIEWQNTGRMKYFGGYVLGVARMLKDYGAIDSEITWGADWDNDTVLKDTNFVDLPHFQIKR
jgi:peptidoglycan L-alanyl-D-glutamate endopeptidase CwlK